MSDAVFRESRPADSASPAARLGAELRAARQNLGWELADLARSLRIRQSYLEAIEAGRMKDLPGTTYALGFVRAYATALGLKGEQVASRFRAEAGEANMRPALSFPAPVPQRGVPAGALMLLGLVVLAGAYSGWYYMSERQRTPAETVPPIPDQLITSTQEKPAPSPQVASILPTASPPAPSVAASPASAQPAAPQPAAKLPDVQTPGGPGQKVIQLPAPLPAQAPVALPPATQSPAAQAQPAPIPALPPGTRVVIKASADAWVTVKQKGGTALYSKLMHAGDSFPVPPEKSNLVMTTGNAGGTELDVDGSPVSSLGATGLVRHDIPLDPAVLKAGLPLAPPPRVRPKLQG